MVETECGDFYARNSLVSLLMWGAGANCSDRTRDKRRPRRRRLRGCRREPIAASRRGRYVARAPSRLRRGGAKAPIAGTRAIRGYEWEPRVPWLCEVGAGGVPRGWWRLTHMLSGQTWGAAARGGHLSPPVGEGVSVSCQTWRSSDVSCNSIGCPNMFRTECEGSGGGVPADRPPSPPQLAHSLRGRPSPLKTSRPTHLR